MKWGQTGSFLGLHELCKGAWAAGDESSCTELCSVAPGLHAALCSPLKLHCQNEEPTAVALLQSSRGPAVSFSPVFSAPCIALRVHARAKAAQETGPCSRRTSPYGHHAAMQRPGAKSTCFQGKINDSEQPAWESCKNRALCFF